MLTEIHLYFNSTQVVDALLLQYLYWASFPLVMCEFYAEQTTTTMATELFVYFHDGNSW